MRDRLLGTTELVSIALSGVDGNAESLDGTVVEDTLSVILKYEGDIRKAQEELKSYLQARKRPEPEVKSADDKDLLH